MRLNYLLFGIVTLFSVNTAVLAHDRHHDDDDFYNSENCVGSKWYDASGNNISIDDQFGQGSMEVTRCLAKTRRAKVLYQINKECKNADCKAAYAAGNIMNHINDFEITHGMDSDDYEIVVIVHSGGWKLVLDNESDTKHDADNPFQETMKGLIARDSVKVFLCQNTAGKKGVMKANMLNGVGFVTAGVSAIADLQEQGYRYVQP